MDADVTARLDRLESLDEIRQLAGKYALALDMRDLDALCGLFPADVRVSRDQSGRGALRSVCPFPATASSLGNKGVGVLRRGHFVTLRSSSRHPVRESGHLTTV